MVATVGPPARAVAASSACRGRRRSRRGLGSQRARGSLATGLSRPFALRAWGHDWKYLKETGRSFCVPLDEERLLSRGTHRIPESTEDLAFKAYVGAHCASRTFGEVELATATASQLTFRNEELAKSLEAAEAAKAAMMEEKRVLAARVEELERPCRWPLKRREGLRRWRTGRGVLCGTFKSLSTTRRLRTRLGVPC